MFPSSCICLSSIIIQSNSIWDTLCKIMFTEYNLGHESYLMQYLQTFNFKILLNVILLTHLSFVSRKHWNLHWLLVKFYWWRFHWKEPISHKTLYNFSHHVYIGVSAFESPFVKLFLSCLESLKLRENYFPIFLLKFAYSPSHICVTHY